jgi:hypothetical protein
LPLAALAIAAFGWQTGLWSAENSQQYPSDFPPPDLDQLLARLRDPFLFPASFHAVITGGFLAFIAVVHFGASWTGSEFARGTIRNVFLAPTRLPSSPPGHRPGAADLRDRGWSSSRRSSRPSASSEVARASPRRRGLAAHAAAVWFTLWFLALATTVAALRSGASHPRDLVYVLAELVVANAPFWRDVGQPARLPQLLPDAGSSSPSATSQPPLGSAGRTAAVRRPRRSSYLQAWACDRRL